MINLNATKRSLDPLSELVILKAFFSSMVLDQITVVHSNGCQSQKSVIINLHQ